MNIKKTAESTRNIIALIILALASNMVGASIITFESSSNLDSPITEAGFKYSRDSGIIDVIQQHLEAGLNGTPYGPFAGVGGGVLSIVSEVQGGLFVFQSIDAAVYSINTITNQSPTLGVTVTGNRNGNLVWTDIFLIQGSSLTSFTWHTKTTSAVNSDRPIDQLLVQIPAFYYPASIIGVSAVDNINLKAVPIPNTAVLFGSALVSAIRLISRRRKMSV